MLFVRRVMTVLTMVVALTSLFMNVAVSGEESDKDTSEAMAMLQETLKLSDEQAAGVGQAMAAYRTNLDNAQAKFENQEEPDPQAMIGEFKKIRDAYYKSLQDILSKDQWAQYEAIREEILLDMFSDIAAIRIIDLKEPLSLTDEQMVKMEPVMGKALRDFVGTIFEYGDQKMNKRTKIKIGRSIKGIQGEQESQLKEILSEEQMAAWEKMKEEQKEQKEG